MIQFKSLKQYTQTTNEIRFPQDVKSPFLLIYYSENSTFLDDYSKLNLRRLDFRVVVVPVTKIPRTRLFIDTMKLYRQYKLFAYPLRGQIKVKQNVILDLSQFLNAIDLTFKVSNYRQRAGFLIKDLLSRLFLGFPDNYQRIFLYSIDLTKEINIFVNRKIFPILQQLKSEEIPFDYMLMNTIIENESKYRLLIKDREFSFPRVLTYLRNIKSIDTEREEKVSVKKATDVIMNNVLDEVSPEERSKIRSSIEDFLSTDKESLEKVSAGISKLDSQEIATTSILYKVSGDIVKSKRLSSSIPKNRKLKALKAVSKNYVDEVLKTEKTISTSIDPSILIYDTPKMVGDKSPEHLFQKRQIDFEVNFQKDLTNSFKILESRDPPLKFQKMTVSDASQSPGELYKSDISLINVFLTDGFGNKHDVSIEVPKINPRTGTFRVNGRTKCLINQIIQCPITFPKPYESRFESSYSIFRIVSKRTSKEHYLEAFMMYKIPLLYLLSFAFGFKETLRLYGLSYEITTRKIKKGEWGCKINSKESILFGKVDSKLKEELCQSFIHSKVDRYTIESEFGTKSFFEELIIQLTGRLNSTYHIESSIQNIVDPVAKQILMNKELPTDLNLIMKYMAEKVIQGVVIERNDITNQRIRNSEILVHLAQEQILASYTVYKEQVLVGNKQAKFMLNPKKVLSDFNNTEVVTDMEYANPIEEMSTMTRVTPVGRRVGGIPDKRAIQIGARNVHPSYFGNIDPLDTPESGNIGIVQQLSIDAYITSVRGMFSSKKITNKEGTGMLSTTTCMVPFLENNEGARVIMLSSQAKQMLPLKNPQPPVVQSGYESILTNVLSDNFIKRSPCSGKVVVIKTDIIAILCSDNIEQQVDISPVHLRSGSGKNTLSIFEPVVKVNQNVKKGEIVAEGSCLSNGSISLGRTLCVAMMPYKGYNFEDGIVINGKLVEEDKLTSVHGVEEEALLSKQDRLLFLAEIGDETEKGQPLLRKTVGEIEQLIGFEETEMSEISAGQYIHKSPGGRIVDIEVFSNVVESIFPQLKELIIKTNKKYGKPPREKFTIGGVTIKGVLVRFRIEQELKISSGDKLCNRYGNKGIISLVEKDENMPRTPFGDRVDVILNPLGLVGRMNIGQLYEMYCGLISKELGKRVIELKDKTKIVNLLKTVLTKLDGSENQQSSTRLINNLSRMSAQKFKMIVDQIRSTGFVPIIIPPFQSPKYQDISSALKVLGLKSSYYLYLPEFKTKTSMPVPIGYMYLSKLEQIGEGKIYGRSTGPTVAKTAQPTSGKRHEGGQRLGELDTYSFISYNCPTLLAEMMGPLSDDYITRDEIISDIIQTGNATYRVPKISPARDLLNSYFASLMLERG